MEPRRRDELASRSHESAIAVVQVVVGSLLPGVGTVMAAAVAPFAKFAAERLRDLATEWEAAGVDEEVVEERLQDDEARARLVADVVRGTLESDLAAKRKLLAHAAVRVFKDLTVDVDAEQRLVRAANMLDTFDVRVLALAGHPPDRGPDTEYAGTLQPEDFDDMWAGSREFATASASTLMAAGLIERLQGFGDPPGWRITEFGRRLLEALEAEGLEEELRS